MFWSQAADVVALWENTSPPKPSPSPSPSPSPPKPSPSPDPFGDSDAEAFIDQLLSDGHLETPAKSCAHRWATRQPALDSRTMDDKMEGGCTQDRATHQPTMKTDDMTVDRHTVESAGECHFMVRSVVHAPHPHSLHTHTHTHTHTHKGAVKCSQVEIERKRELARLRRAQRSKWKAEPAISS